MTSEDAVRPYFAAYSEDRPERFDELVSPDYVVVWIGHLADGSDYRRLSLYRVAGGRVAEIRQPLIGPPPD